MALAIIDDLTAPSLSHCFYTSDLSIVSLGVAAFAIAVLALLNLCVRRTGYILVRGSAVDGGTEVRRSRDAGERRVGFFIPLENLRSLMTKRLEHVLPVGRVPDLPLFSFCEMPVSLQGVTIDGLTSMLPLGIIAGLLIGKPLGISLFAGWRCVSSWRICRRDHLSANHGGRHLCGIGFTMSIFIASGIWQCRSELINWAKLGILVGSLLSPQWWLYSWLRARV